MTALISTYNTAMGKVDHAAGWLTPTLARVIFITVLFVYYWNAATLKIDGSIFSPSAGAFGQAALPGLGAFKIGNAFPQGRRSCSV